MVFQQDKIYYYRNYDLTTIYVLIGLISSASAVLLHEHLKVLKNSFLYIKKKHRSKGGNEILASEKALRFNLKFCYNDKKKRKKKRNAKHYSIFSSLQCVNVFKFHFISLKNRFRKCVIKFFFNQQAFENTLKMKYVH